MQFRTWNQKEGAAEVFCTRRPRANVIAKHNKVNRGLAPYRSCLLAFERCQCDHDLGAGRTQAVGLGASGADWIFRPQTFFTQKGWIHQAEDPDLDPSHWADT